MWCRLAKLAILAATLGACRSEPPPIEAEPRQAKPGMATLPMKVQSELPLPSFPGLKLEASLAEPGPIEAGAPIEIEARLVNLTDESIPVVQVGDGSSVGWREPHVFFTAEVVDEQGVAHPATKESFGRCGNYDADWTDEIEVLGPGESLDLDYFLPPGNFFDLSQPGEVRIRVHYRYRKGIGQKSTARLPASMARVPAFELVSAPVTVSQERRFEVALEAKASVQSGVPVALDEVFRVRVRNVSDTERSLLSPHGPEAKKAAIWFETEPNDRYVPNHHFLVFSEKPKHLLAPGAETVVLGKGGLFGESHEGWTPDEPGTLRVRATYGYARSNWATVTVR